MNFRIVPLAASALILLAAGPPAGTADGSGSITFGKKGEGIGYFDFHVVAGDRPRGTLLFAGEDHHAYPHSIIRLERVVRATIEGRTLRFAGKGRLHREPVEVEVIAVDQAGTGRPDTFELHAFGDGGEELLHAHGTLFKGDIVIAGGAP